MQAVVYIHGGGKLGRALIKTLSATQGISIYPYTCVKSKNRKVHGEIENITFEECKTLLPRYTNVFDYVVVTTPGDALAKQIDFLLSLKKPLIILSTAYDENLIKQKVSEVDGKVVLMPNANLGVLDLIKSLKKIPQIPELCLISVSSQESHQTGKKDISGTQKVELDIFRKKGFDVLFNEEEVKENYNSEKDGKSGNISWLREKESQLKLGVPKEHLGGHGYHSFYLTPKNNSSKEHEYLEKVYIHLKHVEKWTNEDMYFEVSLEEGTLRIIHNIDGRPYHGGVLKAIEYFQSNPCIITGEDLV